MVSLAFMGLDGLNDVWQMFRCTSCGNVVTACARHERETSSASLFAEYIYPEADTISETIPERPHHYLMDAQGSLAASSASIMASCSAIDAMLKEKGVGRRDEGGGKERSLSARIDIAVAQNILTEGMSRWAHKVRLDANDQRHAGEDAPLPTQDQARDTLRLAKAIAELLFVLPAQVEDAEATPE